MSRSSLPQDFRTFDFLMPWEGPEYMLPGDEKAHGEAPGAPSPAPAPGGTTPQNVKTPARRRRRPTAGRDRCRRAADDEATKQARKPRAAKAESEVSEAWRQARQSRKRAAQAEGRRMSRCSAPKSARATPARRVEVNVGGGVGEEWRDDIGHPRDPGDEQISNYTINFGPQHPAAHGVLRLILELDGEIVERVDPHIGLLHRGTEKLIEYKTYAQALPYFDRLDYCSPMCMEHSFVLAIEKLLGLEIPLRAQYIRVMMAELTRISNHMLNLGSHIMDVGAMTPNLWLFEVREDTDAVLRACVGRAHARQLLPRRRRPRGHPAGGARQDRRLPRQPPADCSRTRSAWSPTTASSSSATSTSARSSKDDAIAWGFSGPMIRAAGIPWDIRRSQPYEVYDRMDFDIPVGTNGDCYDRFMVRVEEVRQCWRSSRQCLNEMPQGPIGADRKVFPPSRAEMKTSMEALIHHFKLYTEGYHVPAGEVYVATESPKGEFGVYLVADGTNRPYRCKIRPTGFSHLQAMDFMMKGHMLADTTAVLVRASTSCSGRWTGLMAGQAGHPGIDRCRPSSARRWGNSASWTARECARLRAKREIIARYPEGRQMSAVDPAARPRPAAGRARRRIRRAGCRSR